MKVQALGHAVIKVRDRKVSEQFYSEVLGIPVAARMDRPPMTFFTLGNHHDLAVLEVGKEAPDSPANGTGLFHLAFKVGDTIDELREVKSHLEKQGVKIDGVTDHVVTKSLYLTDPDGNGLELYVDTSDVWKEDPQQVAQGKRLEI